MIQRSSSIVPVFILTAMVVAPRPAAPQTAEAVLEDRDSVPAGERADRLAGLYELEDGRLAYVMHLRDQLDGRPVLSVVEYATGRVRALYPTKSGAFEAGSAWFSRDSIEYRVRFRERDGPANNLSWEEGGRSLRGRRARLVEREVTISSGGVQLAGTLVLPPGEGPFPAVVMVPGSGPLTRRTARYIADYLAYHGVAALAMDKRGTGGSGGEWNGLSHRDWAGDVEAQLDFLAARPEIDPDRLGLFASSEAGYVAPLVAGRRPDVRFLVCRVCPALPHPVVIRDMTLGRLRRRGLTETDLENAGRLLDAMMRFAMEGTGYEALVAHARAGQGTAWRRVVPMAEIPAPDAPYWDRYRGLLEVDPRRHYPDYRGRMLVILGEEDERILIARHRAAFEALADSGVDLTLWVVEGASHGLLLGGETGIQGYPPGLHPRIAEWVSAAAGASP